MVRTKSTPVRSLPKQALINGDPKYTIYVIPTVIERKNNNGQIVDSNAVHPLETAGRLKRDSLTLLQGALTDVIGTSRQGTAHIDDIYIAIGKIWLSIRSRDNLPSNDFKKAVQLSLRSRVDDMPLFKLDPNNSRLWSLCTVSDIESASRANHTRSHAENSHELNSSEIPETELKTDPAFGGHSQGVVEDDINSLTDLQRLISEVIIIDGGSSHFNSIHEYVLKNWTKIRGKDGQPKTNDCRRAILASLSKNLYSHPLFMRDSKMESHWKMAAYNPLKNYTSLPEIPSLDHKNGLDLQTLTDLQKLIIRAIGISHNQQCDFELINDYVSQRWYQLRRRDGSPYAANIKRAIQASLSNNSASQPIFQKESKELPGVKGIWSLSSRGLEFYALLEKEEGRSPIHSLNTSLIDSDPAIKYESDAVNSDWSGDSHHMDNTKTNIHMSDEDEDEELSRSISDENEAIAVLGRKRSREDSEYEENNIDERPSKVPRRQYFTRIENIITAEV